MVDGPWTVSADSSATCCAGHVSAGDEPLPTARRETAEEIGLALPYEVPPRPVQLATVVL